MKFIVVLVIVIIAVILVMRLVRSTRGTADVDHLPADRKRPAPEARPGRDDITEGDASGEHGGPGPSESDPGDDERP